MKILRVLICNSWHSNVFAAVCLLHARRRHTKNKQLRWKWIIVLMTTIHQDVNEREEAKGVNRIGILMSLLERKRNDLFEDDNDLGCIREWLCQSWEIFDRIVSLHSRTNPTLIAPRIQGIFCNFVGFISCSRRVYQTGVKRSQTNTFNFVRLWLKKCQERSDRERQNQTRDKL